MEHEPIFRSAILQLQNGHAKEAAVKFDSLITNKFDFKDLKAYRLWAGVKCHRNYSGITLDQIPPEQRHSAVYQMAAGLIHRNRGNFQKAIDAFKRAYMLDQRIKVSARAELEQMVLDLERGNQKALAKEVVQVLNTLFSKKKRPA
jgi:tetratricopeptide (TPR) repeat protein